MSGIRARTFAALALQLLALGVLAAALLGASWLDPRRQARVLVTIDRSHSVPRALSDAAVAEVGRAAAQEGAQLRFLEFAGRPAAPASTPGNAAAALDPSATNIESALQAALAAHADEAFDRLVVVSDGFATDGDTNRGLRAVREAGLPLHWIGVARPVPPMRIEQILAPDRALVGQRIRIGVHLAGARERPVRVSAVARFSAGDTQAASSDVTEARQVDLEFDAAHAGAVRIDVAVEDPESGESLDAWMDAAVVDVSPRSPILYARGSGGALAQSLLRGGWALTVIPAARLDGFADELQGYQAVILDDVAVADAGAKFWTALTAAVRQRGLGLMVLGGERSFARGGYRGSMLESILPVTSEAAAQDRSTAMVFLVDKSGSMGQGSGGVDRFQLAQRAVIETARSLGERDSLGLVVFDVTPRVLIPLAPAPAVIPVLERSWQVGPKGGTNLGPALEAAIAQLQRSPEARRLLVLVTDGFVGDTPLGPLRDRLEASKVETIALAVGPDADAGALRQLVGEEGGVVLKVNEAAELPLAMRAGVERRRARIERGTIAVQQRQPLPFAPGMLPHWPPIAAYAVTRPQPDATVVLQSEGGEPLIAYGTAGRGRVVAVTSGLGHWTPQWLPWPQWPRLVGGLTDWVSAALANAAFAVTVSDLTGKLLVDVDVGAASSPAPAEDISLAVTTPVAADQRVTLEDVAPRRLRGVLPDAGPGLYSLTLKAPAGLRQQSHLRRQRTEARTWGTSPALGDWRAAGLVRDWSPDFLKQRGAGGRQRPIDRTLIALGLVLILAGVLVDRSRVSRASVLKALRQWRGSR